MLQCVISNTDSILLVVIVVHCAEIVFQFVIQLTKVIL